MEGFGRIIVRRIEDFRDKVSRALLASGLKPDDKVALISLIVLNGILWTMGCYKRV